MTNNSKTNKLTHYAAEIDSPSGNHIWDVRIIIHSLIETYMSQLTNILRIVR